MKHKKNIFRALAVLIAIGVLVAIYFLTPINDYLTVDKVKELTNDVPQDWTTALIFILVFAVGGALLIPIPLMAFSVSLVFDLWFAVPIAIVGFTLASLSGYFIGRFIGVNSLGSFLEKPLNAIEAKLDHKGGWAVFALRLAPTPPFTITSIISGTLKINMIQYLVGSTLGIAPLGLSAVVFGKGALEVMKNPSSMAITFIIAATIIYIFYRVLQKKQASKKESV
ncbi:VTT domain-containing protein [Thalassotalea sp. 1_MG-2023]|uniref:TVP38/TMEM64 family protein n=1 Tax=Thalassotalea sp. 1_MG-2023 TaxID=3062680 RepID=UPI0026E2DA36|nr:VTT domain-containing protein [Thalassotalea sp. 1_MG-2023]MDO6428561.1 VTT domain-containing protein [Thalassotalea sp. 1_MG-2023]